MKNIEISFAWLDDQGRTREGKKTYRKTLAAGAQDRLALGIRITDANELSRRVRVEVTGARVAE